MSGSLAGKLGTPDMNTELEYCTAVVLSVQSDVAVKTVIEESLRLFNNEVGNFVSLLRLLRNHSIS